MLNKIFHKILFAQNKSFINSPHRRPGNFSNVSNTVSVTATDTKVMKQRHEI